MNDLFRNTIGPVGWVVVGLVPLAIVALYFLRLRREPVEVPSTYLWTKAIEDLHVNSLWQRLRKSLLLLLQLIVVALAMLALLRPGWRGEGLEGRRFIFLIDRSASMSTADMDGTTRLDSAKRRVAELIEQLDANMSAMIIAFDEDAQVVQGFTSNGRVLESALDRIQATAKGTDIRSALELAAGFARSALPSERRTTGVPAERAPSPAADAGAKLLILSDGRFEEAPDFSLDNLQTMYLPFGRFDTNNLAVTVFNARRNEVRPEQRQAFVQATNFSDAPQTTMATLWQAGRLIDAAELTIPAGSAAGATFNLGEAVAGVLEVRLEPPTEYGDGLALDNRAYAVLDQQRQARVLLVTPGNRPLELGLSTVHARRYGNVEKLAPDVLASPEFQRAMQSRTYDLVIFDQCTPEKGEQMPQSNTLFIGRLPPMDSWREQSSDVQIATPQIIDWQRSHPLLNLVELGNVTILNSLIVRPPTGGAVLVDSDQGPLMALAPRDSFEDVVTGFELVAQDASGDVNVNTNWPLRHSFPNFCLNIIEYLARGAADFQQRGAQPGHNIEFDLPPGSGDVSVRLPDGTTTRIDSSHVDRLNFRETDQLGIYEVRRGGAVEGRFAVNLLNAQESDVRLRGSGNPGVEPTAKPLTIGFRDIAAQSPQSAVRRELWTWLLLAALFALVLEWYIYNRRVYM